MESAGEIFNSVNFFLFPMSFILSCLCPILYPESTDSIAHIHQALTTFLYWKIRSDEVGLQEVDELIRTYHHSCAWFLGPFYNLVRFFHPDFVKPLLLASASITFKDELFYGFMRPWLGQGLLLSNGKQWARQRRLLTPAFHFDILKNYIHIFNSSTNIMHRKPPREMVSGYWLLCKDYYLASPEKWRRLLAEGKNDLDMIEQVSLMTLDSLLKCTFSYDSHCQEKSSEYISAIYELSVLVVKRQRYLPHHWEWLYKRTADGQRFHRACEIVHNFTASIVEERRSQFIHHRRTESSTQTSTTGNKRRAVDFIEVLLLSKDENGEGLSNEEIKAQADTFMFAGHDTTASAISWVLYNLAMHQEYQDRCRSEINALLDGRDTEELMWFASMGKLSGQGVYLQHLERSSRAWVLSSGKTQAPDEAYTACFTERRRVTESESNIGDICLISVYGTHHNPDVWPNPETRIEATPALLKLTDTDATPPSLTLTGIKATHLSLILTGREVMSLTSGLTGTEATPPSMELAFKEAMSPLLGLASFTGSVSVKGHKRCLLQVYDPMRFDLDNQKQRSPYAFVPFSAGPRNCIGQNFAMAEIRVVLALTLRRFRVLPGYTEQKHMSGARDAGYSLVNIPAQKSSSKTVRNCQ
ncbi:docosahexaenoic acid omega-hydroxylase CYP4F3-like [Ictalurus punctatus]|uniref:Cytochrome P450 CYP4F66 n=1 Tax=Ictalurus punctatus TaxID=7998 RepID=V5NWJ6_ICTPU|nr:docosahexaenoic acid omega-hydroxylase CYP4F3-like [Ictalurus punctatus]AHA93079.1 cytochrome P450 CYP4F66 [Ictalurus punctatus]